MEEKKLFKIVVLPDNNKADGMNTEVFNIVAEDAADALLAFMRMEISDYAYNDEFDTLQISCAGPVYIAPENN